MAIFFTSDTHFFHANVIRYCNRPFTSVEEMNQALIDRWNSKVGPTDEVYHMGDFAFANQEKTISILNQLNGRIYLVKGNHDKDILKVLDRINEKIVWAKDYYKLHVQDKDAFHGRQPIILCHYAFRVWDESHRGSWHLYGHSHGSLPENDSLSFDAGVDSNNYAPISYQEVKDKMLKKQKSSQEKTNVEL